MLCGPRALFRRVALSQHGLKSHPRWPGHGSSSPPSLRHFTISRPTRNDSPFFAQDIRISAFETHSNHFPPRLYGLPTTEIYGHLRKFASAGALDQVKAVVDFLIRDRGEKPNASLYSALILANVRPEIGSAQHVSLLLEEMEAHGISLDSTVCHDVLTVLSVHVDYLLRTNILEYMRQRWFTLTTEGRQHVAAALLREGDLELGLDAVAELQAEAAGAAPAWLVELAVDILLEANELNSALDLIMTFRPHDNDNVLSSSAFLMLLDEASAQHHLSGTLWAWNAHVTPGPLEPGTGICLNVLATAAEHGNSKLATEAFQRLGSLGHVFTTQDYEELYKVQLASAPPNVDAALATLSIMAGSGLRPTASCMRPMYQFLRRHPEYLRSCLESAVQLHHSGRSIPLPVMNTLLEVHAARRDHEGALEVYEKMPEFENYDTPDNVRVPFADSDTFQHMYMALDQEDAGEVEQMSRIAARIHGDQEAMGIPLTEGMERRLVSIRGRAEMATGGTSRT